MRGKVPDAMWFAFFSCSERRGLSSILPEELGLAETSRAPFGEVVIVGEDIVAIIVLRYDDCVLRTDIY
jgi:hypothetical protein